MQSPVPPIEYEILEYKVEKNLRYNDRPVWKRKRAPQAHEFEGGIGKNHNRQIHTDMVENETQDTSVLVSRDIALLLDLVLGEESEALEEEGGESGEEEDALVQEEGDNGGQLEVAEVSDEALPRGLEDGRRHCGLAGGEGEGGSGWGRLPSLSPGSGSGSGSGSASGCSSGLPLVRLVSHSVSVSQCGWNSFHFISFYLRDLSAIHSSVEAAFPCPFFSSGPLLGDATRARESHIHLHVCTKPYYPSYHARS